MNILERLDKQPRRYHIAISILLALLPGLVNFWAGFAYRMEIFYLLPVSYGTWFINRRTGIAFSLAPLLTMLPADIVSGGTASPLPADVWNIAMVFAFFIIVTLLLSQLRITLQERARLITNLQNALNAVKELSGVLPICANCKKIRDDEGYWHDVDIYITRHTKAEFTHGLCADCASQLYPSLFDRLGK